MTEISYATLEKLRIGATTRISREIARDVDVDLWQDFAFDQLVWAVTSQFAAQKIGESTVTYPADWWQAFKDRWFPGWALKRWPVKFRTFDMTAYQTYPEIKIPSPAGPIVYHVAERESWENEP